MVFETKTVNLCSSLILLILKEELVSDTMSSATSRARKLVMAAALVTILTAVCGQCPSNCHCSSYKTFCSLARLNDLPTRVENATHLLRIELDNITQLHITKGLENLTRLELVKVQLKEIQPGAFRNVSRLQYLEITQNYIKDLKTNSFQYLSNLYFLNLSLNEITHFEPGAFYGLLNMKILDISDNKISLLQANAFEGMGYNLTVPEEDDILFNFVSSFSYSSSFHMYQIEAAAFQYLSALTCFKWTHYWATSRRKSRIPSHISFGLRISNSRDIEYVNRNYRKFFELSYLDMSDSDFSDLKNAKFQNFTKLSYLDLSGSGISEVNSGYFEGLAYLETLNIKLNFIRRLNNGTFHGLQSLEILDISHCYIKRIEIRAFDGLPKLRTLDLRGNQINGFKKCTFSTLRMLKELKLEGNRVTQIDYGAFSELRQLKAMSNLPGIPQYISNTYENPCVGSLNEFTQNAFVNFQRLDNLDLLARVTIPKDIQVLKSLHLYADARSIDPQQELRDSLKTVRYVRDLSVTILHLNSTQYLASFPKFQISTLTLACSYFRLVDDCLSGMPVLKALTLIHMYNTRIQERAFRGLKGLTELALNFKHNLTYTQGSFFGLENLRFLKIGRERLINYASDTSTECLARSVFLGLDNLIKLELGNTGITCLNPGAFEGLDKIEGIYLGYNRIEKIEAGVFGALCKEEFEISCKNVTLPEYCNDTKAIKTLKYLNLADNKISHIHPHAFISCTNLHTLDLSFNKFSTLDDTFLYTPGLRKLKMEFCEITNIPNNIFGCTPLLSEINFGHNKIKKITVATLLPLKHLQSIDLVDNSLSIDCELYKFWIWIRDQDLRHLILGSESDITNPYVSIKQAETQLYNLNCKNTITNIYVAQNRTNDTNDFAFFKQYIEPIVLIVILIAGLVCNGFLLFVSLSHSDMRKKQNACIIHLAIVDLLSLLLNLLLSYWDVVNIRWEFDDTLCKTFIFAKDVIVGVNVFSVVALSVERFLVARTFKSLKKICKSDTQPTAWLLLMTWISGIVCSLPAYFSATVDVRCLYCPPGNQDYIRNVWTFQIIMYCVLSAFAITYLNIKTSLFLRESIHKIPGEIKDNVRAKNRKTVANIVLLLVAVFLVSFLPNYILRVLVAWSLVDMKEVFLPSFFTYCLFFFNTIINPISIFVMSSKFKSYVLRYFSFQKNI